MPTEKKIQAVQEMTETLTRSSVVIGADYRGLSVEQATALRRAMREAGIQVQVVKNTLFLRAAEAAGMPGAGELAEGPTAIIYGFDDPLAPIKTVVEYQRQSRNAFQARKAFMDGEVIPAGRLADLAALPPKDVLVAEIVGALQSPITNLVYLLTATLQEFSGLLDARAGQMDGGQDSSPPEAAASIEESPPEAAAEPVAQEPPAEEPPEEGPPEEGPPEEGPPGEASESGASAREEAVEEATASSEKNSSEEEAGEEDGN